MLPDRQTWVKTQAVPTRVKASIQNHMLLIHIDQ